MAVAGHDEATVVAESAAAIVSRLDQRMADVTGSIQQMLVTEIADLRDDPQLLQLLRDSVDGNVATVCSPRSGTPSRSRKSSCRPRPSNTHGAWRSAE